MMRVCFLNHTLDPANGAGKFGSSLLSALGEHIPSFQYKVLTSVASGDSYEASLLCVNIFNMLMVAPKIRSLFKHCDLIHALDGYPFGVIAALISWGLRKPLVITAVGTGALRPLARPIIGRILRWAYRRADAVTAISHYTKRELTRLVPGLLVTVINHGVDAAPFEKDAQRTLSPEDRATVLGLQPFVLSVGALKPRKGHDDSIRAFARVHGKFPQLRHVIVGGGDDKPLRRLISELGLESAVIFFSHVPQEFLITLYQKAELFLLLPREDLGDVEGFGLVFLEAAASGTPVIGTRESGAEDALRDGDNGILVPPRDVRAAADAMFRILSDPEFRTRLSNGSRAFARRMSWSHAVEQYANIYQSVLNLSS